MKALAQTLNVFAWLVFVICVFGGVYLFWEDHQDVMEYISKKPDSSIVKDNDKIRVALIGEKKLSCDRVPWSEQGYAIVDGYQQEAGFRWINDLTPLSTFPVGKLDIGIAEYKINDANDMEKVEFIGFNIEHICHGVLKRSPIYWTQINER